MATATTSATSPLTPYSAIQALLEASRSELSISMIKDVLSNSPHIFDDPCRESIHVLRKWSILEKGNPLAIEAYLKVRGVLKPWEIPIKNNDNIELRVSRNLLELISSSFASFMSEKLKSFNKLELFCLSYVLIESEDVKHATPTLVYFANLYSVSKKLNIHIYAEKYLKLMDGIIQNEDPETQCNLLGEMISGFPVLLDWAMGFLSFHYPSDASLIQPAQVELAREIYIRQPFGLPEFNPSVYMETLKKSRVAHIYAVQQNGMAIKFVPEIHRTNQVWELAVKQNGLALAYSCDSILDYNVYKFAVKQNGIALAYIPEAERTAVICQIAVQQNRHALEFVPSPLQETAIPAG